MDMHTDRAVVSAQYADTTNLQTRRSVWGPGPEGISPGEVLRDTVVALAEDTRLGSGSPTSTRGCRVLEIGCGTGEFAAQVTAALDTAGLPVDYVATDASGAMVTTTAARGVTAMQAVADRLPFPDDSVDVVVAAWMLYHVPDLSAALAEVRRVLRPGGTLVAVTNGDEHLATLLTAAGGGPVRTQFSSENARASLAAHFTTVTRRDVETLATFPDHAAAAAYLASFSPDLAAALPHFEGNAVHRGHTSVFTAS